MTRPTLRVTGLTNPDIRNVAYCVKNWCSFPYQLVLGFSCWVIWFHPDLGYIFKISGVSKRESEGTPPKKDAQQVLFLHAVQNLLPSNSVCGKCLRFSLPFQKLLPFTRICNRPSLLHFCSKGLELEIVWISRCFRKNLRYSECSDFVRMSWVFPKLLRCYNIPRFPEYPEIAAYCFFLLVGLDTTQRLPVCEWVRSILRFFFFWGDYCRCNM
jgi:hypothetical protein